MSRISGGNSIVHRYSKSFTSHDGCLCCKRTLLDGIWDPTIKITLAANTAGAITAEFHADCVRKFIQSGRQWGWTPHFKKTDPVPPSNYYTFVEHSVPAECEPVVLNLHSSGSAQTQNNVERGSFHRSTCIVSRTKNDETAIKFHLTNGRDCIVRLAELEKLLASTPEPLACNPLKVVFSHLFFEKGTRQQCDEKLLFLEVPEKKIAQMYKSAAIVENCHREVQALIEGKGGFQSLNMFHGMHPNPVVEDTLLQAIVEELPPPSVLDLKDEFSIDLPSFAKVGGKKLSENSVIKVSNDYWRECPKLKLKFKDWAIDFKHYGVEDLRISIKPENRWDGSFDSLVEYCAKGYSLFANGKCTDPGYVAEGLVSQSTLCRQAATHFTRKMNEN